MTTTVTPQAVSLPLQEAPARTPTLSFSPKNSAYLSILHQAFPFLIAVFGIIIGYNVVIRIFPTPRDLSFPRERMTVGGVTLSPISAFIKLEEQTRTNNPPTSIEIKPPDYVENIPDTIGDLKELETITIRDQPIHTLPESLGALPKLHTLIVINTPLTSLPNSLGNLPKLEMCIIAGANIRAIPDSIGNLTALKGLAVPYNKLASLPRTLSQVNSLTELDLTGNNFRRIPNALPPNIKFIYLGGNQIPTNDLKNLNFSKWITGVHY